MDYGTDRASTESGTRLKKFYNACRSFAPLAPWFVALAFLVSTCVLAVKLGDAKGDIRALMAALTQAGAELERDTWHLNVSEEQNEILFEALSECSTSTEFSCRVWNGYASCEDEHAAYGVAADPSGWNCVWSSTDEQAFE